MSFGFERSRPPVVTPPTGAPAYVGACAAALAAAEVSRLLARASSPAFEVFVDLASRRMLRSELTRNPACLFDHESWEVHETGDVALRQLLLLMDAVAADVSLAVAGDAFVDVLRCACGTPRRVEFLLAGGLGGARGGDPGQWLCPHCGGMPVVTGFDRRERIEVSRLSPDTTRRSLGELGLRSGDVLDFDLGERGHHRFVVRDPATRAAKSAARKVVVVGSGNIGSYLVPLLAREVAIATLVVVDQDRYEAGNMLTQNLAGSAAIGRNKAEVQAEYARSIRTDLEVEAHAAALEDLPWGVFGDAIVVGALDSRLARMHLHERAWRMGSVFVDTGVAGAELQVRASIYPPRGQDGACPECAWDESDYAAVETEYPCAAARREHEEFAPHDDAATH